MLRTRAAVGRGAAPGRRSGTAAHGRAGLLDCVLAGGCAGLALRRLNMRDEGASSAPMLVGLRLVRLTLPAIVGAVRGKPAADPCRKLVHPAQGSPTSSKL